MESSSLLGPVSWSVRVFSLKPLETRSMVIRIGTHPNTRNPFLSNGVPLSIIHFPPRSPLLRAGTRSRPVFFFYSSCRLLFFSFPEFFPFFYFCATYSLGSDDELTRQISPRTFRRFPSFFPPTSSLRKEQFRCAEIFSRTPHFLSAFPSFPLLGVDPPRQCFARVRNRDPQRVRPRQLLR